jgi:CRP-like cAMP-binding protein
MQAFQVHPLLEIRALLTSAGARFSIASYEPRAVLFRQGDVGDSVMHIETGRVWLSVMSPGGRVAITSLLDAGAFLGDDVLAGRAVRRQTAVALTTTAVLVVPKAQMMSLLHTQQALADEFIAHCLSREAHLQADLADQILSSSEQRLARTLLVLAGCEDRRACRCELPSVPQEVLAEMVGTTRSHVNVFMGKVRRLGFIEQADGGTRINASLLQGAHDVP